MPNGCPDGLLRLTLLSNGLTELTPERVPRCNHVSVVVAAIHVLRRLRTLSAFPLRGFQLLLALRAQPISLRRLLECVYVHFPALIECVD